ncbi:hypothetical protein CGS27_31410, partial [Enterobacter cloacae]
SHIKRKIPYLIEKKRAQESAKESVEETVDMIGMAEQITNYMSVIRSILSHFTIEKKKTTEQHESTMRELMRQVESQGYLERAD